MAAIQDETVELRVGALRLAVRPDMGGAIAGLWHNDVPVLRSLEATQASRVNQCGCYVLLPYSNRIASGRFSWEGRAYQLALNVEGSPHPLHGVGHRSSWNLQRSGNPAEVALTLHHCANEHWPFDFTARQSLQLNADSLRVELSITNTAAQPVPVGLGWHPYFPRRTRSRLRVECDGRWDLDAGQLPTQRVPQSGIDAEVSHLAYDHVFEGWKGPARIRDERFAVTLRSSLDRLVIYTPRERDFFCVEPVSHVTNAINQALPGALGLVSLQPGQTHQAWMTLDIQTTHE